jgi:general stress protein 26
MASEQYYEDLTAFALSDAEREELLQAQSECGFCWATRDGWPIGVIMAYVWRDGRFWLTATNERKRIRAIERDPRCSIIVSSAGSPVGGARTVTAKGRCTIHADRETKDWYYRALAERLFPEPGPLRDAFMKNLDIPSRVVLEVVPEKYITCDAAKMMAESLEQLLGRA